MKADVSLMHEGNPEFIIDYLIKAKIDFILKCSNYTIAIDSEVLKERFVTTMQQPRTFGAFAKLKKDLKNRVVPDIDPLSVRYFQHNFKKDCFYPNVFNVDLKSAYATILQLDKLITQETFKYLKKLGKQQRLAAVGMLASHKELFHFKKGTMVESGDERSPFSGFFFYLVKRTDEIMSDLKKICGRAHLFTWVDGIYFLPDETVLSDCLQYLDNIKFPYSVENLTNFEVRILDTHTKIFLTKDGKQKPFSLPHNDKSFQRVIKNVMLNNQQHKKKKTL